MIKNSKQEVKLLFSPQVALKYVLFVIVLVSSFVIQVNGQNITRPNISGPSGLQINSFTGGLFYKRQDLYIPGSGLSLDISFTYNSADRGKDVGFGFGWTFNYGLYYVVDSTGIIVKREDGRQDFYEYKNSLYTSPAGIFDVFAEYETGKFKLTSANGISYFFENSSHKKVTGIKERNGNEITLTYNGSNLSTITDGSGRSVNLLWSNSHLSQVKAEGSSSIKTIDYQYNAAACLTGVKDPLGNAITYGYGPSRVMSTLTDRNNNTSSIIYNDKNAVIKLISCKSEKSITYNTIQSKTYLTEKNGDNTLVTIYVFDDKGRLITKEGNCCGFKNSFTYDASNNVNQKTDANGNTSLYTYNSKGSLLSETDPYGKTIFYTYTTDFNNVSSITDKNGNKKSFLYDNKGNLIQSTDALGIIKKYSYDGKGNRTSYTDGRGNKTSYTYDDYGNIISTTIAVGGVASFTYDMWGNVLSKTDLNGNKTIYAYDALNRNISTQDALNNKTVRIYDANGNTLSVIDARSNSTAYLYDAMDKPVSIKDAAGNMTSLSYDAVNNLIAVTDANHNTTEYSYDHVNRLIAEKNALGERTFYSYDNNGNKVNATYPNGNSVKYTYDKLNRVVDIKDNIGIVTSYSYDGNNNKLTQTDAKGNTVSYKYDALNRMNKHIDPLGNGYSYDYDANGNMVKQTDRNGNATTYSYDNKDRRISEIDALGRSTTFTFDKAGNTLSVTDAKGNGTKYTYDATNRVTEERFADNTSKSYAYNAVGNTISRKDNKGQVTNFKYDELNRPVHIIFPTNTDSLSYDALGRLVAAKNVVSTVLFTYDVLGRPLTERLNGKTTSYSYTSGGGTKTITYPGGRVIQRKMDVRNELQGINQNGTIIAEFAYNAAGEKTGYKYTNNTSASFAFNANSQVTDLTYGPSRFVDLGYRYDNEGNALEAQLRQNTAGSQQYAYDKLNQLTGFRKGSTEQGSFNYDEVGNRTTAQMNGTAATYSINNMNAYSSIQYGNEQNLGYDANGNLTSDGSKSYTYDFDNRITKVNNGQVAEYSYDALGRRVKKVAGNTITNYYFDGLQVVEERDELDSVQATNVWGTWIDDIVSMNRNGKNYYYHTNSNGSVLSVTDASGVVVERYEYDAFGKVAFLNGNYLVIPASAIKNTYTYTGRQYEPETGLYYYRARYYDVVHGRFLQRDPLGYNGDGYNLYTYVRNNPINKIDPLGLISWGGVAWGATQMAVGAVAVTLGTVGRSPQRVAEGTVLFGSGLKDMLNAIKEKPSPSPAPSPAPAPVPTPVPDPVSQPEPTPPLYGGYPFSPVYENGKQIGIRNNETGNVIPINNPPPAQCP